MFDKIIVFCHTRGGEGGRVRCPICQVPICGRRKKLPWPNLPPRGPICRGPICRGPICHQQVFRGPICRTQNFPGPNLPGAQFAGAQSAGAQFAGAQSAGAQFATKIARGPICQGPNLPRTVNSIACFSAGSAGLGLFYELVWGRQRPTVIGGWMQVVADVYCLLFHCLRC